MKYIQLFEEFNENIHNTASMGGILSNHYKEDRAAIDQISELIKKGTNKEDAILKIANQLGYRITYLTKIYDKSVNEELAESNINEKEKDYYLYDLAKNIYDTLKSKGAEIGNASIPIIHKVLKSHFEKL